MSEANTHLKTDPEDEANRLEIIRLARNEYQNYDGDIEIDDNAVVSHGTDNGAYVQAWVWVGFGGTRFDKDP
ncbi:MAG: hypothetical protein ACKVW3_10050 [Phycisphaerales bacterium]